MPVAQHVALVGQLSGDLEVVVGPAEALTEHHRNTIHLDALIGVIVVLIAVVVTVVIHTVAIHAAVITVVIVVHVGAVVVVATDIGLA